MDKGRYVRSNSFRERYLLEDSYTVIEGSQCPIDLTPLVSGGSPDYRCLACGAQYPRDASPESIRESASKYVQGLQEKLAVTGRGIQVKDVLRTIRVLSVAKRHGLMGKV